MNAEIRKRETSLKTIIKKSVSLTFFSIMHSENKNILPIMDVTVSEVQSIPTFINWLSSVAME